MTLHIESLRLALKGYFNELDGRQSNAAPSPQAAWRLSCFEDGVRLADVIENDFFSLKGKRVYDVAGAWGGHALAFALRGCECLISDLNDHKYNRLAQFVDRHGMQVRPFLADCMKIPLPPDSCDVVIGLELVEHIPWVERFAEEVVRVLRKDGVCIVTTPAKLKAIYEGEPHYGIKGLAALPFRMQGPIARGLFGKKYPYPIERQYWRAKDVIKPFAKLGMSGVSIPVGKAARLTEKRPLLRRIARQYLWRYIFLQK
jgi:SAM-dependent methyltransferase